MSDAAPVKTDSGSWMTVLATYSMGLAGDTELVVGELRADLKAEDPAVVEALEEWGGPTYLG